MTNKETIERNIGLTFDFTNYLIDNPDITEDLPNNFSLEFVEKDFSSTVRKSEMKNSPAMKKKYIKVRNTFEMTK